MSTKSSAHYQREYRKRLREQGLVKKEIWILPENTNMLADIEKHLREQFAQSLNGITTTGDSRMTNSVKRWTTEELYTALSSSELGIDGSGTIELIEGVDPTIHITMHDYGDLPVFLTVSGEQIIVESILWAMSEVNDIQGFNDAILRTHKYFPLSTVSLDNMADGSDYYQMFGALSSTSSLENILFEVDVLANNVIQATSAYSDFLAK